MLEMQPWWSMNLERTSNTLIVRECFIYYNAFSELLDNATGLMLYELIYTLYELLWMLPTEHHFYVSKEAIIKRSRMPWLTARAKRSFTNNKCSKRAQNDMTAERS